jgi:hypothetical protein
MRPPMRNVCNGEGDSNVCDWPKAADPERTVEVLKSRRFIGKIRATQSGRSTFFEADQNYEVTGLCNILILSE